MKGERGERGERGQILPLVAGLVVVCGLVAIGLGRLGARAVERARAQSAADAGALAGAAGGPDEAQRAVVANGGEVVALGDSGGLTRVEVDVGEASARAAARVDGGSGGGGGGPPGVAPGLRAVLARVSALVGRPVPVTRVLAGGLVVDVDPALAPRLASMAAAAGICRAAVVFVAADADPNAFGICPPPASALAGQPDGG